MNVHVLVDRAIGAGTQALQRRLPPKDDTSALLESYRDLPLDVLFPAPPERPFVEVSEGATIGRLRTRKLRVASAHLPLAESLRGRYQREHEALHLFHARELSLRGRSTRRAVVYLHGWMESTDLPTEVLLAPVAASKLGADFFHLELPHHWRRQIHGSKYNGAFFCSADLVRTSEAFRQSVLDARTLIQWIRGLGRYDEVGLMGFSLGGVITQIVACCDPELSWAVPFISHLDLADMFEHASILAEVRAELATFGVNARELDGFVKALGFDRLAPAIDVRRMLAIVAQEDQFMRPEAAARALARWPGVRVQWVPGGHITSLFRLPSILSEVRRFVDSLPARARSPR